MIISEPSSQKPKSSLLTPQDPEDQRGNRNQGRKHSCNEDICRKWHLDLKLLQIQMPKHKCKNTINDSQDNMSPAEPNNPTTASPEYSNTAETQDKDLKTHLMKMTEVLKEEVNKSL